MRGPKEKKERALGERLGLKAERSNTPKSAVVRKPYRPGQHGQSFRRGNSSDFSLQLKAKQKFKISYGLKEKQLEDIFMKGINSRSLPARDKIFDLLESRLDNVVYRLGLAPTRTVARQLVLHGHITAGGKKVTYPGYRVKINETIGINPASKNLKNFSKLPDTLKKYETPSWLLLEQEKLEGKMVARPTDVEVPFDVNLVVEYYSK